MSAAVEMGVDLGAPEGDYTVEWTPSDVWEPWHPQVGDRVRVRLSGECKTEMEGHALSLGGRLIDESAPGTPLHDDVQHGRIGTVRHIFDRDATDHCYGVEFDESYPSPWIAGVGVHGAGFAAIELEPLEPRL